MNGLFSRRWHCLSIALLIIPVGLAWRLAPLHLPPFAYKWGGSILWAVMVYLLVAAALPAQRPQRIMLIAGTLTTLVELSRLLHTPALDAFRLTLAGKLLLGRIFSMWDIIAYWAAIAAAARIDRSLTTQSTGPSGGNRPRLQPVKPQWL